MAVGAKNSLFGFSAKSLREKGFGCEVVIERAKFTRKTPFTDTQRTTPKAARQRKRPPMKTMILPQLVLFTVSLLTTASANAQDFKSYFGQSLPKNPVRVKSIADNLKGLQWATSMMGQRIGAGECTDLVKMHLVQSGARAGDFRAHRNYKWGAIVTGPTKPGDVIQFEFCKFKWTSGNSWGEINMDHHTAIISSRSGSVLQLIHQNAPTGGPVTVQTLDLAWKVGGRFTIWRPVKW